MFEVRSEQLFSAEGKIIVELVKLVIVKAAARLEILVEKSSLRFLVIRVIGKIIVIFEVFRQFVRKIE